MPRVPVVCGLVLLAVAAVVCRAERDRPRVLLPDAPWMDVHDTPAQRADKLVAAMTLEEKVAMLHGKRGPYIGNVGANARLGIPALTMNDGPQGFRDDARPGTSTSWPCGLAVGASFDVDLARQWGEAMGAEFYNKGANVQLGPGMCLARVPVNGRNFEYISGEDPYLGNRMVGPVVQGIQSNGVIANAKHWVLNNQETQRITVSANADARTRWEMYYPPFVGAVEAGVASVMCSYNRINGRYSCQNGDTLAELKEVVGFDGWVMSDWGATHSTAINEGLDQEMPVGVYMNLPLLVDVVDGKVSVETVNASVARILTPMFQFGLFDNPNPNSITNNVTTEAHAKLARTIAAESSVLLKNNGALPINASTVRKLALIGGPVLSPTVHGGGSGSVKPWSVATPYWGIRERFFGSGRPASNCSSKGYEDGVDYYQPHNLSQSNVTLDECCALCGARRDCQYFSFAHGTCYFKATNDGRRASRGVTSGRCIPAVPECVDGKCLYYASNAEEGARLAAAADMAIVFVETSSSEGTDRDTLSLGADQDALVNATVKAQPNTVVVAVAPGAILTPWRHDVAAALVMFMPGQEFGTAVADVLFGDVNPSGRLPLTFPNKDNEVGFTKEQYPGVNLQANYTEKLEVGYRWYDAHSVEPAFPFGHGLSYTQVSMSGLKVAGTARDGAQVNATVSYGGGSAGKQVVQLFLRFPESAGEPPMQLKGFKKVWLGDGEEGNAAAVDVQFSLRPSDLSVWEEGKGWVVVEGEYGVFVGLSSRNILLNTTATF